MKNILKKNTKIELFLKKDSLIMFFILNPSLSISFHMNQIWIDKKMKIKYDENVINSMHLQITYSFKANPPILSN